MLNKMKKFLREEGGLEMVEWAIVGALITAAGAGAMATLGSQVALELGKILGFLTSP